MQLVGLRLFHFRNIDQQEIIPSPSTNLFFGLNGQGKTNLLEAIYFLGYGRSFRTARPKECIRYGDSEAAVEGAAECGGVERTLKILISEHEKKLFVHEKSVPLDEFVGGFHVIAFTSTHLSIVRGAPAERRAFLDRAMVTLFPGHLHQLASYGRALRQRNRILSSADGREDRVDPSLLETWGETLVHHGARILLNRRRYVELLKEELQSALFGTELLKIHYASTIPGESRTEEEIRSRFRDRLRAVRSADQKSGFTSVGPHRDDLKLYADGRSLADFGSAGQQRSCLLALYFSQMEIHRKDLGFYPVLLVDDVEAELDDCRLAAFLRYITERTQTFMTTAKASLLPSFPGPIRRFEVRSGRVLSA